VELPRNRRFDVIHGEEAAMVVTTDQSGERAAPRQRPSSTGEGWESRYDYCCGDHELILTAPRVTAAQAGAVESGEAQFALIVEEPVIILCSRFGEEVPWTAAPVCWHSLPSEARRLPPSAGSPDEVRALLHVTLEEGLTGRRRAERNLTLWLDFTRALNEAIRDQVQSAPDPRAFQHASAKLKLRAPTPESLIGLARARSLGSP
jgi:hypothetical protein